MYGSDRRRCLREFCGREGCEGAPARLRDLPRDPPSRPGDLAGAGPFIEASTLIEDWVAAVSAAVSRSALSAIAAAGAGAPHRDAASFQRWLHARQFPQDCSATVGLRSAPRVVAPLARPTPFPRQQDL